MAFAITKLKTSISGNTNQTTCTIGGGATGSLKTGLGVIDYVSVTGIGSSDTNLSVTISGGTVTFNDIHATEPLAYSVKIVGR